MNYADEERGNIHYIERYKQPVCFGGLKYGRITPTDIDGLIEYRSKIFVLYELKKRGTPIQHGQKVALENIINSMEKSGRYAALFKCEHDIENTDDQVDAANSTVTEIYVNGKWFQDSSGRTAKEATDSYFEYLRNEFHAKTPLDE